jgi:hypothetical protein
VVLVSSEFGTRADEAALVAALAPAFTVFAYDRRGRGESGDPAPACLLQGSGVRGLRLLMSVYVAKSRVCCGHEGLTSPAGMARRTAVTCLGTQTSGLETSRDRCRLRRHIGSGQPVADAGPS